MKKSEANKKREEEYKKVCKENCRIIKDAVNDLLLIDILTNEEKFFINDESFSDNSFYIIGKLPYGHMCLIKVEVNDIKFLGLNRNVINNMYKEYDLHQNWYYFKIDDVESLLNMIRKCMLSD